MPYITSVVIIARTATALTLLADYSHNDQVETTTAKYKYLQCQKGKRYVQFHDLFDILTIDLLGSSGLMQNPSGKAPDDEEIYEDSREQEQARISKSELIPVQKIVQNPQGGKTQMTRRLTEIRENRNKLGFLVQTQLRLFTHNHWQVEPTTETISTSTYNSRREKSIIRYVQFHDLFAYTDYRSVHLVCLGSSLTRS